MAANLEDELNALIKGSNKRQHEELQNIDEESHDDLNTSMDIDDFESKLKAHKRKHQTSFDSSDSTSPIPKNSMKKPATKAPTIIPTKPTITDATSASKKPLASTEHQGQDMEDFFKKFMSQQESDRQESFTHQKFDSSPSTHAKPDSQHYEDDTF